jgi:hypothetical protein
MRTKLTLVALGLLAISASPAFAAEEKLSASILKADQFEIGGGFSFATQGGSSTYTLSPSLGYFITDNISVGSSVSLRFANSDLTGDVSASGSYYFMTAENYSPFATQSFGTTFGETTNSVVGATGLGVSYFITQHIGFNTTATLSYNLNNLSSFANNVSFGIVGAFAIYLK